MKTLKVGGKNVKVPDGVESLEIVDGKISVNGKQFGEIKGKTIEVDGMTEEDLKPKEKG